MHQFLKTQTEITAWLDSMNIKNYTLVASELYGFVVDVDGSAFITSRELQFLPVKFNRVNGTFNCGDNRLTSLAGTPEFVGKDFFCDNNLLTNLLDAPKTVNLDFDCSHNQLTSLKDHPQFAGRSFNCRYNLITSLEGAPQRVAHSFFCDHNQLSTLEFAPSHVGGSFYCHSNQLIDLTHCPQNVGRDFVCHNNPPLGDIQAIIDFKQIYQIHLDLVKMEREKNMLSHHISSTSVALKTHKI